MNTIAMAGVLQYWAYIHTITIPHSYWTWSVVCRFFPLGDFPLFFESVYQRPKGRYFDILISCFHRIDASIWPCLESWDDSPLLLVMMRGEVSPLGHGATSNIWMWVEVDFMDRIWNGWLKGVPPWLRKALEDVRSRCEQSTQRSSWICNPGRI